MRLIKKWTLFLLLFVVFVVTLVAASENSSSVSLQFLNYHSPEWPVSWWMLCAFVAGVLVASMLALISYTRLRFRYRAAMRQVERAARELDRERNKALSTETSQVSGPS
ncbi:MAG: LapA family protein [Proteobacteria bacterium]|nr:LapA family protein [Pseudomonadota bacterium]MDA1301167.1 LapA family protein [Pseudomonadota bacterium]